MSVKQTLEQQNAHVTTISGVLASGKDLNCYIIALTGELGRLVFEDYKQHIKGEEAEQPVGKFIPTALYPLVAEDTQNTVIMAIICEHEEGNSFQIMPLKAVDITDFELMVHYNNISSRLGSLLPATGNMDIGKILESLEGTIANEDHICADCGACSGVEPEVENAQAEETFKATAPGNETRH